MYHGPEFRHLVYFLAVAEECNFGKAAHRLHLSQPSLSEQIKQLEAILDATLFTRGRAGAGLTASGRKFLPHARRILQMSHNAVRATSPRYSAANELFRLGYSPFINHELLEEAFSSYPEIVPEGRIHASSECSGDLLRMIDDGRIDAAIVSLPMGRRDLFVERLCEEKVLVCLRRDDPVASLESVPADVASDRLSILFGRDHHPHLYDELMRKLGKSGIEVHPSEFVSSPAEMQFLVKTRRCFGLVRENAPLDPALTRLPIEGVRLRVSTAFVCHPEQKRPVVPILAYRVSKRCEEMLHEKSNRDVQESAMPIVNRSEVRASISQ